MGEVGLAVLESRHPPHDVACDELVRAFSQGTWRLTLSSRGAKHLRCGSRSPSLAAAGARDRWE